MPSCVNIYVRLDCRCWRQFVVLLPTYIVRWRVFDGSSTWNGFITKIYVFLCSVLFFALCHAFIWRFKSSDWSPGPADPTADQIANTIDDVPSTARRPPTTANVASVVTWCQLIAPAECVKVGAVLHNSQILHLSFPFLFWRDKEEKHFPQW